MAGMPGRSGGHNRLSAAEHVLRGTYRKDRHGPRPARAAAATPMTDGSEPVPALVTEGLGEHGRRFVKAVWCEYDNWSHPELTLLRAAARTVDDYEAAPDAHERRQAAKLLAALIAQLKLEQ
jgi:hypothetical protein